MVDEYRQTMPLLLYGVEEELGVSAARNLLVRMALDARVEYVIFVDDDEWVDRHWLESFVGTAREFNAKMLLGPVVPAYNPDVPAWAQGEGFFERARHTTGEALSIARTGDSMIATALFDRAADNFPRTLRSGEDTYFFVRAREGGGVIIWCDEAVVFEEIPADRANARWLVRRAFDGGLTYSRTLALLGRSW
ncbi:MAG: succinoglycan biosynthesis protein ExoM [Frankiales bacterium]|nr:succinoglycan biosynthesis protein ExoM [Frankiales bacterium]